MKFCKNLQRVVDISNSEWAPYYVNYKFLKKLIKELPSLVPPEDNNNTTNNASRPALAAVSNLRTSAAAAEGESEQLQQFANSMESLENEQQQQQLPRSSEHQNRGDETAETTTGTFHSPAAAGSSTTAAAAALSSELEQRKEELGRNPGEKAFFKLLHAEFRKASHFFDRAQQEFQIREERVRKGMEIMKHPNSIMVNEKWSLLAKSIYRLYKDLLLLETFAIMTYCSFSKILKKHDKVTGHETRRAFMENVVNKANFTNYPRVLEMISRCENLYDEVSQLLHHEGNHCLYEDERLFINMISRLNEQVLNTAETEGAPCDRPENRSSSRTQLQQHQNNHLQQPQQQQSAGPPGGDGTLQNHSHLHNHHRQQQQRQQKQAPREYSFPSRPQEERDAIHTLRTMVEEHDAETHAAQISETDKACGSGDDHPAPPPVLLQQQQQNDNRKRAATSSLQPSSWPTSSKHHRTTTKESVAAGATRPGGC